jgi:hypothetical protein
MPIAPVNRGATSDIWLKRHFFDVNARTWIHFRTIKTSLRNRIKQHERNAAWRRPRIFFLEHAGGLRISILRRKNPVTNTKGFKPPHTQTHTLDRLLPRKNNPRSGRPISLIGGLLGDVSNLCRTRGTESSSMKGMQLDEGHVSNLCRTTLCVAWEHP